MNNLKEMFQSAYVAGHSTETALLRVRNDVLAAMDNQKVTLLIMLDLSSAFDTIDHKILLNRLSERLGIQGDALLLLKSYLENRGQFVSVQGQSSRVLPLEHGVPQGSVLGPVLFSMYITPLGDLARDNDTLFHLFADDNQIYLSFSSGCEIQTQRSICTAQTCVREIDNWLGENMLKNNGSKLEAIIFWTQQQRKKLDFDSVVLLDDPVMISQKVKKI